MNQKKKLSAGEFESLHAYRALNITLCIAWGSKHWQYKQLIGKHRISLPPQKELCTMTHASFFFSNLVYACVCYGVINIHLWNHLDAQNDVKFQNFSISCNFLSINNIYIISNSMSTSELPNSKWKTNKG